MGQQSPSDSQLAAPMASLLKLALLLQQHEVTKDAGTCPSDYASGWICCAVKQAGYPVNHAALKHFQHTYTICTHCACAC